MFVVDAATTKAIRRIRQEQGELSALVELRRHFPLIADNTRERLSSYAVVSYTENWVYVIFAAVGWWIGAFVSLSFGKRPLP